MVADDELASVGKAYPTAGNEHGFRLDTRLTAGTHNVCVYSINKGTGTGNPKLGCNTVTITAPPVTAAITSGNPLGRLAGVELEDTDGRTPRSPAGRSTPTPDAAGHRADLRRRQADRHGRRQRRLGRRPEVLPVRRQRPRVHLARDPAARLVQPVPQGVDQGAGSNASIGCKAVTVVGDPASNPKGRLASAWPTPDGTVTVEGWSYDPDLLQAADRPSGSTTVPPSSRTWWPTPTGRS